MKSQPHKKRLLAVITARGGSKGLPRKNVLLVDGKPLIAWTISAALKAKCIDRIILSSDDAEIIDVAKSWGCEVPFRRPAELAGDTATSVDVVLHAISQMPGYDYVMLLQPTSPLRTAQDIDSAFSLIEANESLSCASVCESEQSPYWMYRLTGDGRLVNLISLEGVAKRRQDLPPVYVLNGAIYVVKTDWFCQEKKFISEDCIAYVMPKDRSIDIDTGNDFAQFRSMVEGAGSKK